MDWAWESLSSPICSSLTESSNFTLPLSLNPFFTLLPLPHYLHPLLLCSLTWVTFYNLSYYPFLFSLRGWSAEIEPPLGFSSLFFLFYSIQFTRHWFDLNPNTVSYSISYFSRWILQYMITGGFVANARNAFNYGLRTLNAKPDEGKIHVASLIKKHRKILW